MHKRVFSPDKTPPPLFENDKDDKDTSPVITHIPHGNIPEIYTLKTAYSSMAALENVYSPLHRVNMGV